MPRKIYVGLLGENVCRASRKALSFHLLTWQRRWQLANSYTQHPGSQKTHRTAFASASPGNSGSNFVPVPIRQVWMSFRLIPTPSDYHRCPRDGFSRFVFTIETTKNECGRERSAPDELKSPGRVEECRADSVPRRVRLSDEAMKAQQWLILRYFPADYVLHQEYFRAIFSWVASSAV